MKKENIERKTSMTNQCRREMQVKNKEGKYRKENIEKWKDVCRLRNCIFNRYRSFF